MYTERDGMEITIGTETDKIFKELLDSLLQGYQENLEQSMRGIALIFDRVDLLYYKYQKININRAGSYINPPNWLKNKKATINPKNNDEKCFQYSIATTLNFEQIKSHPERIPNIKLFINQYNWERINFPSQKKSGKKFEANNKTMALNILYVPYNSKEF